MAKDPSMLPSAQIAAFDIDQRKAPSAAVADGYSQSRQIVKDDFASRGCVVTIPRRKTILGADEATATARFVKLIAELRQIDESMPLNSGRRRLLAWVMKGRFRSDRNPHKKDLEFLQSALRKLNDSERDWLKAHSLFLVYQARKKWKEHSPHKATPARRNARRRANNCRLDRLWQSLRWNPWRASDAITISSAILTDSNPTAVGHRPPFDGDWSEGPIGKQHVSRTTHRRRLADLVEKAGCAILANKRTTSNVFAVSKLVESEFAIFEFDGFLQIDTNLN